MTSIDKVGQNRINPARPSASAATATPAANRPLIARDELRTAGNAVRPRTRLTATQQMQAERPKFRNPDEYRNYVIKFKGYHETAKNELATANQALAAEKGRFEEADAELSKPLNAAKKVMQDTHALYQEAIDRVNGELASAKDALHHATYPGARKAAELDAEAGRLAQQISSIDHGISNARSRIGSLETAIAHASSRLANARSDRSAAESRIYELEPQAPSEHELSTQRGRVNDAAARKSEASSRVQAANAKLAKKRDLEQEIGSLTSALDSVRSAEQNLSSAKSSASAYKGQVTRAQNDLDEAMGLPDADAGKAAKVTAARSRLAEATEKYNTALGKVEELESRISRYGSAADVSSRISSLRSQLSSYSGAEGEYQSASSALSAAEQTYANLKRRLDDMVAIDNELDANRRKRDEAIRAINEASATIASANAEKGQKNREIDQLQDQLETKTREKNNIVAEANRERARQNPPTHAQVVAASNRVNTLQGELKAAQATYDQKIAGPKAKVDEEQKVYNEKIRPFKEKVADAERNVGTARKAVEEVATEFEKLKGAIGFWKGLWWRIRYHFNVKDFWKEQGHLVAMIGPKSDLRTV